MFESVSEFLNQFDSYMSKGGMYLDSDTDWELRKPIEFSVRIRGTYAGVDITAEVVHCAAGKVGLQMAPDSEAITIIRGLADDLRTGPVLRDDGYITYPSTTAFLTDFEANVASGGFYLETGKEWPVGETREFVLCVGGEPELPMRATPVMCSGGMVSLQLEHTRENVGKLNDFVKQLRKKLKAERAAKAARKKQAPEQRPTSEERTEPAEEQAPSKSAIPAIKSFQGTVVASRDATEFEKIVPLDLKDADGVNLTLFSLVASLSDAKQAVSLLIESNGDRLIFNFNDRGDIVEFQGPKSEVDFLERLARAQFIGPDVRDRLRVELGGAKNARDLAVESGAATEHQASIVFKEQLMDALEKVRALGQARFLVEARRTDRVEGVSFTRLIIPWLERALKSLEASQVKKMLKPIWDKGLRPSRYPAWPLEEFDIEDESLRYVEGLDGSKPLKKTLTAEDKARRDKNLRLVLSLKALQSVVVDVSESEAGDEPDKSGADTDASEEELEKEIAALEEADVFTKAGVHWSAHPNMYEQAMRQIHRDFGPASDLSNSSPRAKELCKRRMEIARAAMVEIRNPDKRVRYREDLVPHGKLVQSAKLLAEKAEQFANHKKLAQAIEYIEMADELDPRPEYKIKLESFKKRTIV